VKQKDVLEKFCEITKLAANNPQFRGQYAHDCFCGMNEASAKYPESFQFSPEVINFIRTAVQEKLDKCEYIFRNLPCNILPEDELWCVTGFFSNGGGVLEWCYNENDANERFQLMSFDKRFSELKAQPYKNGSF